MRLARPRLRQALSGTWLAASLLCASSLGAQPLPAEPDAPGRTAFEPDHAWGRWRTPAVGRPAASLRLGCSDRHPLCVHLAVGDPRVARRSAPLRAELLAGWLARALAAGGSALDAGAALGLPAPLPDEQRGGDDRYDLYLVMGDSFPAGTWPDPPSGAHGSDRSSAFARLPPPTGGGCEFELRVARSLSEASLLGLSAAVDHGTLGLHGSYLAAIASPCLDAELDAIDAAQRSPELGITHCGGTVLCGGWPFAWYLDATYGVGEPGGVMTAAIALAHQNSGRVGPLLPSEPDAFDVLRRAALDRGTSLDDILLDFSVARAFIGSRSDGVHLPGSERLGDFGRVRFDWSVPLGSLPRRLAPRAPIFPTGASYLWLDLEGAADREELLFEAEWEPGQVFRWALVKVDAEGREMGRIVPGVVYGQSRAQQTVSDLTGAAGLIVVGVAIGSDDRSRPFDPDLPASAIDYSVTLRQM